MKEEAGSGLLTFLDKPEKAYYSSKTNVDAFFRDYLGDSTINRIRREDSFVDNKPKLTI